jgi:hypothetical protein
MALTSQILAGDNGEQLDISPLSQAATDYRNAQNQLTQNQYGQNQTQPTYDGLTAANDEMVTADPAPAPLPPVAYTPPAPVILPPPPAAANDTSTDQTSDDTTPVIAPVIAAPLILGAVEHHHHPHHNHHHAGHAAGYLALKIPAPTQRFDQPIAGIHHTNSLMPRPTAQAVTAAIKNLRQFAQTPRVNFNHMNPNFLIVASKMVSDMRAHGEHIVITSAFRTASEQSYLRHHRGHHGISSVVAHGTSNHQRGDAMDIRTNYAHLANYAVNYGLVSGAAFRDPMHVSMPPIGTREYRAGIRFAERHLHSAERFLAAHNRRPTEERLGRHGSQLAMRPAPHGRRHLAQAYPQPGFAG